jgi:hypothetical protein
VTAIFERAYPNGNYPNYIGDVNNRVSPDTNKWLTTAPENQAFYLKQIQLSNPAENDYTWRIVLAFSAIPAACTMYFRLHMAETPRFTLHVLRNATAMTNGEFSTSTSFPNMSSSSFAASLTRTISPSFRHGWHA